MYHLEMRLVPVDFADFSTAARYLPRVKRKTDRRNEAFDTYLFS